MECSEYCWVGYLRIKLNEKSGIDAGFNKLFIANEDGVVRKIFYSVVGCIGLVLSSRPRDKFLILDVFDRRANWKWRWLGFLP